MTITAVQGALSQTITVSPENPSGSLQSMSCEIQGDLISPQNAPVLSGDNLILDSSMTMPNEGFIVPSYVTADLPMTQLQFYSCKS